MSPDAPLTMTEREAAREQLRASIDALADQANLHVQMQKDPLKMLGGASAVGALLGIVVGRQFRRSRRIYVDAESPVKHQKALIKAQKSQSGGGGIGGALIATLGTLAVKTLTDRVITPRLEGFAESLLDKAGTPQTGARPATPPRPDGAPARPAAPVVPVPPVSAASQTAPAASAPAPTHPGVLPHPPSVVEAKAQGSVIPPEQMANPNRR
ncbi:hypothetical protein HNQ07_000389 [Deinococcus metalli]|uniref:Uncharacterized protein n=1 Tax=Deinococcus metalli TaxID=1141878 RepID=A0A7W8NNQ4_9DEIO|nr:hypothetical protein [Deinococcus metalli]MBB5374945.1 hypothetical protein [Deinococcus metalli]GHF32542.1 hypothetical protein GCM10017781_06540 [Deinococcus metalli]